MSSMILVTHALILELESSIGYGIGTQMHNYENKGQLTTQIDELKKEVSDLKIERKALFFIASCGISYAVLQISYLAAIILFVVSFSLCFLEDIVKGK